MRRSSPGLDGSRFRTTRCGAGKSRAANRSARFSRRAGDSSNMLVFIQPPSLDRIACAASSTRDRRSASDRIRIAWPAQIAASAFRCLELLISPSQSRFKSWSPTTEGRAFGHAVGNIDAIFAANATASRRGIARAPVKTMTSPVTGPSALPTWATDVLEFVALARATGADPEKLFRDVLKRLTKKLGI